MTTDTETTFDTRLRPQERGRILIVLGLILAAVLLTPLLPDVALDTPFADLVVRLTDTASWNQMTVLSVAVVVTLVVRPALERRRRAIELRVLAITMLVALVGMALVNEHIVKPFLGVPRPNIVELADAGILGADIPDADAFYAVGDKAERRALLGERLTPQQSKDLSELVRAHWIHETGYSFPSGHTTSAVTFATMLTVLGFLWLSGWRRWLTTVAIPIWAVAVAYSRPLLEVHTAADVIAATLAGFCWGVLAAAIVAGAMRRFGRRASAG